MKSQANLHAACLDATWMRVYIIDVFNSRWKGAGMTSETEAKPTAEVTEQDATISVGERPADGITVSVSSAAGVISIVRSTEKAVAMMQHC